MAESRRSPGLETYLRTTRWRFERAWRHPIDSYCGFHQHPVFEIVYHVSGSGKTTDGNGEGIRFVPGAVVVYPPKLDHDQRMETPGEDLCIHVGADDAPPRELARSLYVPRLTEAWVRAELFALAARSPEMPAVRRLVCDHRTAALFLELIAAAGVASRGAEPSPGDRHAAAARAFIRSRYRTMRDVSEAAGEAGISYDRLRHCFRERYGISMKRWHMEVRVDRARDLLLHSNLPLKAIADLCGFRNPRYFSTCFRQLTGRSPGAFRAVGGRS